ncbi:unnamed protein product [Fraxinus pennsylvanica]|uniref:Reverse transcriptase domain-containing protein n=1 Tax=Fraxinus pennsylvanica TaxID=56036 RepID=A0AAD1ZRR3_9LAMI|nr:unnamed protein product [Fraxinus pennsylvanica]
MGSEHSFFPCYTFPEEKTNMITKLLDDQDCWQEEDVCNNLIINYYSDLFSSTGSNNHDAILNKMENKLTPDMNNNLIQPFTTVEVAQALKEMHPTKALGPDCMPPLFFQRFWPNIGSSITNVVLHALNTREFPSDLNHTFITLIPKTENPQRVKDFKPISLCNVMYKLVSKVVANRIKIVISIVISET